jgi:hypothetical protein
MTETNENQEETLETATDHSDNSSISINPDFKKNLGESLVSIDQDAKIASVFIFVSIVAAIILFGVVGPFATSADYEEIFTSVILIFILTLVLALWILPKFGVISRYSFYLRRLKPLEREFIVVLEEEFATTEPRDDTLAGEFIPYLQKLQKATIVWEQWAKNKNRITRWSIFFFMFLMLVTEIAYLFVSKFTFSPELILIVLIFEIASLLIAVIYFGVKLSHFRVIQLGREIFYEFSAVYLRDHVRDPIENFVRSNNPAFDKRQLLDALGCWDKYYRQAFFTNKNLNTLLQIFHPLLFPLEIKQNYYELFQNVKTRLQSFHHFQALYNEPPGTPTREIKQVEPILDIFMDNLKSTITFAKEGKKEKFDKISIAIAILAMLISVFNLIITFGR